MRETGAVGNTYVLVSNPGRSNGGILERFNGVSVPILDITFNGATPTDGDITYDIARQYDGWADFPKYPLNLLATANALLGIVYLHGKYDQDIDPAVLDNPAKTDKTVYNNTTYYLIHTDRLPLLMPFNGILPYTFLDALDAPLRELVELGYHRTNYGNPSPAGLLPKVNTVDVRKDLADATTIGLAQSTSSGSVPAAAPPEIHPALTGPAPTESTTATAVIAARQHKADQDVASLTEPPAAPAPADDQQPTTIAAADTSAPTEPAGRSTRKPDTTRPGLGHSRHPVTTPDASDAGDAGVQRKSGHRSLDAGTRTGSGHRQGGSDHPGPDRAPADWAFADSES